MKGSIITLSGCRKSIMGATPRESARQRADRYAPLSNYGRSTVQAETAAATTTTATTATSRAMIWKNQIQRLSPAVRSRRVRKRNEMLSAEWRT
jgi:hypothetical protein